MNYTNFNGTDFNSTNYNATLSPTMPPTNDNMKNVFIGIIIFLILISIVLYYLCKKTDAKVMKREVRYDEAHGGGGLTPIAFNRGGRREGGLTNDDITYEL